MTYRHGQGNFSKGILSKELWGRADIAPYGAGVRDATNLVILKYGGLTKRPGTRLVYQIKDGDTRLLPFEGAFEAPYVMVMGQAVMRLATLGGMVVEEALTIETVALTTPVQIRASYHGLTSGNEVYISGAVGPDDLNGRIFTATVIDLHHFTIPVNGTTLDALVSDSGGIIRSGPPTPPPADPVVPAPAPAPTPPRVGGGGFGDYLTDRNSRL